MLQVGDNIARGSSLLFGGRLLFIEQFIPDYLVDKFGHQLTYFGWVVIGSGEVVLNSTQLPRGQQQQNVRPLLPPVFVLFLYIGFQY